jgi:hypothetical protein
LLAFQNDYQVQSEIFKGAENRQAEFLIRETLSVFVHTSLLAVDIRWLF